MPTHRFLAAGCALSVQTLLLAQFVLLAMVERHGAGAPTPALSLYSIAVPEAAEAKPVPGPSPRKTEAVTEAAAAVVSPPVPAPPEAVSVAVSAVRAPAVPVLNDAGSVAAGAAEASGPSGTGNSTSGDAAMAGRQSAAASATDPGIPSSANGVRERYAAMIAAWLERHKAYPAELAARGSSGVVCVRFRIDAQGRVRELALVRGSGMALLDRLALAQVAAAAPFPRPPAGLDDGERRFEVPLRYRPRG